MADQPELRAGDQDRDRTVTLIREAYAEGRLDSQEFQSRMGSAQQARTFGELAALVADLPVQAPTPGLPAAAAAVDVPVVPVEDHHRANLRKGWASWLGVGIMMNVIWLGTWVTGDGDVPSYWPIWVIGPWGAAMLIATLKDRAR